MSTRWFVTREGGAESFVITGVKEAEWCEGLVVRGDNVSGEGARVRLELSRPLERAERPDLNEESMGLLESNGQGVRFAVGPWLIATVGLEHGSTWAGGVACRQ